jgi:hypothetical protein
MDSSLAPRPPVVQVQKWDAVYDRPITDKDGREVTTVRYDDGEVLNISVEDVDDDVVEAFELDEHAG